MISFSVLVKSYPRCKRQTYNKHAQHTAPSNGFEAAPAGQRFRVRQESFQRLRQNYILKIAIVSAPAPGCFICFLPEFYRHLIGPVASKFLMSSKHLMNIFARPCIIFS